MTKKITLTLNNPETNKQTTFSRDGLNVMETLNYYEFAEEKSEETRKKFLEIGEEDFTTATRLKMEAEDIRTRAGYIADLFEGVTPEMVLEGIDPDEFDKEWFRIMGIIAPRVFGNDDEDEGK